MKYTEIVNELINRDVIRIGWTDEQPILNGKYILKSTVTKDWNDKPSLQIKVYDPKINANKYAIAHAQFRIGLRWFTSHLIASLIHVDQEYQKQGIATAMYKYIRDLGNTIRPSFVQLGPGKAMWKSFKRTGALR